MRGDYVAWDTETTDKFPDDAAKAAEFMRITKAYETLSDPKTKADFDRRLKARAEREKRDAKLDSQNRKLKDSLETRERDAKRRRMDEEINVRSEIERIRAENLERVERAQAESDAAAERAAAAARAAADERVSAAVAETVRNTLCASWTVVACDDGDGSGGGGVGGTRGGYTDGEVRQLFGAFGPIEHVLTRAPKKKKKPKKNREASVTAVVSFATGAGAAAAMRAARDRASSATNAKVEEGEGVLGRPDCPIRVRWVAGGGSGGGEGERSDVTNEGARPAKVARLDVDSGGDASRPNGAVPAAAAAAATSGVGGGVFPSFATPGSAAHVPTAPSAAGGLDFESLTLMRMRQASERQRLIAQMQREDEEAATT